jgi:thiamine-monophosphate kinase
MSCSEFDIIERFFRHRGVQREDVVLGVGDDAALLQPPAGRLLVSAVDTLVAGRHFPLQTAAFDIAWKALAVNLSDLAAMGATPAWALLALTLPEPDLRWLEGFADGFFALAEQHAVALVGGDTTRGPLSISIQLQGFVEPGRALRRDAARPGDAIFVSGTPGDAALALQQLQSGAVVDADLLARLNRPQPRVALGQALAGLAAAAIDISDGLLADLGHLLNASACAARLWPQRLPRSAALQALPEAQAQALQFNGGDDYELCFTVPAARREALLAAVAGLAVTVREIGVIEAGSGLVCESADGQCFSPRAAGFDHFRDA